MYLFVRVNSNCLLPGGVSGLLSGKQAELQPDTACAPSRANPFLPPSDDPSASNATEGSTHSTASSSASDPFGFLSNPKNGNDSADETTGSSGDRAKGAGIGRFLKKVAKSTTQTIERGMHNLAIRADQGRNPDILSVGLYDTNDQLLCLTEEMPVPEDALQRLQGLRFVVPLRAPQQPVLLKLWIQSGAPLLQQTKAAKRFLVGIVHLSLENIQTLPLFWSNIRLHSQLVVDGMLHLFCCPDTTFPALCGRGWSLTDPDQACYSQPASPFNMPLDQPYSFSFATQREESILLAIERTTESTLVLPAAAALAQWTAHASHISVQHAQSLLQRIRMQARFDQPAPTGLEQVACNLRVMCGTSLQLTVPMPLKMHLMISWQRPDTIFEASLCPPVRIPTLDLPPIVFYPRPCRQGLLPAVWQANRCSFPPHGFFVGNVRLQFSISRKDQADEAWDCIVCLDEIMPSGNVTESLYPIVNANGQIMGQIGLAIDMKFQPGAPHPTQSTPATGGLVTLMGVRRPIHTWELDYDSLQPLDGQDATRRQQLATMGWFLSAKYLEQHLESRQMDTQILSDRARLYRDALLKPPVEKSSPHQERSPRAFRPSSSRSDVNLAGIGFNVHTAMITLNLYTPDTLQQPELQLGGCFHNMTAGAPSDHARGFSNVFPGKKPDIASFQSEIDWHTSGSLSSSPIGPVEGGLRRLESKRVELADLVVNLQTSLTMSIANYFVENRQYSQKPNHYIPERHAEISDLRWKLCAAVQALHHLSWHIAVRRAACFSQALGIALSSYMTSVSDPSKWQPSWADHWARHGYLVTFEGLLSAAGKELGMIEDASVAISMLSMVQIILVSTHQDSGADAIPVVNSPYLQWIRITPSGSHPEVSYTVHLGIIQTYYDQRIPEMLRGGTSVRLYPLLFEVGVDIRQWGANTGSSVKSQIQNKIEGSKAEGKFDNDATIRQPANGLVDDEDDDAGVADNDVLVELNMEAFSRLNTYAQNIFPTAGSSSTPASKTHPMCEALYQHIVSSAGRINHDIVNEAATLSQKLGGGGVVFCKSGKDRTAMHVTYKQAQFVARFREIHSSSNMSEAEGLILKDATIMRVRGTRLRVCEKNVGQPKYAFNSLQVKFMPETLRPPLNTLAGFLKGGKIFTGEGIES